VQLRCVPARRLLVTLSLIGTCAQATALMPMPAVMSPGDGKLIIDASFSVRVAGYSNPQLVSAVAQFTARVSRQTGIPIAGGERATLTIDCRSAAPEYPTLGEDESYQLDVTPSAAHLSAPTVTGALRGLQTFSQLIAPGATSFVVPAIHIEDRPRFPWRGLMLDVSRHWMPLAVVMRNIDAMAAVKLNVFHWHLSDDQGFRVESKLYPKLQQLGSDGNFYTRAEMREVIDYARNRGIRVVPEFDIPGHTTSWFVGYPELASAPGAYRIERNWGIFEPTLDVSREETYTFLDGLLGEMAALFPDPYFHIGGDEVLDREWRENTAIQAFCAKNGLKSSLELHAYFNRRVQQILKKHGKKMIGWDEVLAPGLTNDVVIQSWRGQKSLAEAAGKGYRGILSFGYYLNKMQTAAFHYQVDPLGAEAKELNTQQAALILGGEACMWSEYVTTETVDSRLWPRTAVIAERLWSPANVTDPDSMYRRLETVTRWLDWFGVEHRTDYARLLDRLAGETPAPALRVLADAVEALGIDYRQDARHYNSTVPMNRFADAARPESESVRNLKAAISRLIGDPAQHRSEIDSIRIVFAEWAGNKHLLDPCLQSKFLLLEVAPVSESLSKTGAIGLEALQYLESGKRAPADWVAEQKQELDKMEQPKAEVVLAAVRPVRALLDGISQPNIHTAAGSGDK
jgi:hexosaminidase